MIQGWFVWKFWRVQHTWDWVSCLVAGGGDPGSRARPIAPVGRRDLVVGVGWLGVPGAWLLAADGCGLGPRLPHCVVATPWLRATRSALRTRGTSVAETRGYTWKESCLWRVWSESSGRIQPTSDIDSTPSVVVGSRSEGSGWPPGWDARSGRWTVDGSRRWDWHWRWGSWRRLTIPLTWTGGPGRRRCHRVGRNSETPGCIVIRLSRGQKAV